MNVTFHGLQQFAGPMKGTRTESISSIDGLFRSLRGRKPFLFEMRGDNGITLTIGYSDECGTVQYGSSDGLPPYLMAVANDAADDSDFVEFLSGGTPTPISRRFCLPIERVGKIAADFLARGNKSESVIWEEI